MNTRPTRDDHIEPDVHPDAGAQQSPDPVGEPPDPFDPARLRLSQDFASSIGVRKAMLTVPVKKPSKEWWVQTHPNLDYCIETAVLELKEDREIYLVAPELRAELATEPTFGLRALFTSITRQGVLFLWPVRLPNPDGRHDEWSRSAMEAALMARGQWVRVTSNMQLGAYEVRYAEGDLAAPEWPDETMSQILRIAFRDRYVDRDGHPILRRLRGAS